ncbi:hypothetical protein B5S32_g5218 [[Candida] boidinii]|nr:hypothetical protein B5S32_g5218 [[Candida] boidinii]
MLSSPTKKEHEEEIPQAPLPKITLKFTDTDKPSRHTRASSHKVKMDSISENQDKKSITSNDISIVPKTEPSDSVQDKKQTTSSNHVSLALAPATPSTTTTTPTTKTKRQAATAAKKEIAETGKGRGKRGAKVITIKKKGGAATGKKATGAASGKKSGNSSSTNSSHSNQQSLDSFLTKFSSANLLASHKAKLKHIVELDSIEMKEANILKILNNELQILATPNGVVVEPKFIESMKSAIVTSDRMVGDKLSKRLKSLNNEFKNINELKSNYYSTINEIKKHIMADNLLSIQAMLPTIYPPPPQQQELKQSKLITNNNGTITEGKRGKRKITPSAKLLEDSEVDGATGGAATKKRKLGSKAAAAAAAADAKANGKKLAPKQDNVLEEGYRMVKGKNGKLIKKKIPLKQLEKMKAKAAAEAAKAAKPGKSKKGTKGEGKGKGKGSKSSDKKVGQDQDLDDSMIDNDLNLSQDMDASMDNEKLPNIKLIVKPKITIKEQRAIDKQYDNTYVSIWKDLSRKDGPKAYRMLQQSIQSKQINLRKTALLAARESKRWSLKTNKNQKDLITKARRSMREMLNFWKKNEREERELRKKAEKEAADLVKKEEEEREAKRQARKLNFLITQTELYSHFIGNKIRTDEFEGDMGDKALSAKSDASKNGDNVDLSHANKDFNSLDFGEESDETLHRTAAANAQNALLEAQQKARAFNEQQQQDNDDNEGEMNFQNPTSLGDINIEQPKLLNCTLKEYQMKGLNWLANLYDQGINGILADEMGLGKTVQSISVLSYLAESQNIWGPFLVVTPASTLHNWQQEISKFVPDFKVLPYWGTAKDRKVLRKFWDRKNIVYNKNSPFHVLVTSYQLVVSDAQYFQKMKWQYMILDEAQAIKSSQSSRWKSLLSFQCRNRLLLTGTPIQNSMQELWALLHFIMPSLFDSHDEFSEWFSKDIESHATSNTQLNEQQLRRLHMILKPFMLRRIKKNVQSELGDKIEIDVYCELTTRQKKLYRMLRSQISLIDILENHKSIGNNNDEEGSGDSLMNLVMQFRKVCNHPDLFERADVKSAFSFSKYAETSSLVRENNSSAPLEYEYSSKNMIEYPMPKLIFDEIVSPAYENNQLADKVTITDKFSIWSPENIAQSIKESTELKSFESNTFDWLKFVDETPNTVNDISNKNLIDRSIDLKTYSGKTQKEMLHRFDLTYHKNEKNKDNNNSFNPINKLLLIDSIESNKTEDYLKELVTVRDKVYYDMYINVSQPAAFPLALAPVIDTSCPSQRFQFYKKDSFFNEKIRSSLSESVSLDTQYELLEKEVPLEHWPKSEMLPNELNTLTGYSSVRMPSMKRFVIESGKLSQLDRMLVDLKKGDHKCLIYFQMTKMMDLMEEYLTYKQYKYIRLDGSSKLSDRRDLVHDWQTKPELFIFLLSTRAGGLGINLTSADTVIFYDSDWNPTIDSQAMDRAHRLGQTRQVTVYRLLTRGTIEQRMRDRAKQKEHVQQVVMEGKASTSSAETSEGGSSKEKDKREVAMWLLDDDNDDDQSNVVASSKPALTPTGENATNKKIELIQSESMDKTIESEERKLEALYHEGEGSFTGANTPQ